MTDVLRTISDGVGRITLNRPDHMNAITVDLAHELEQSILGVAADVNVVLIRGAGGNFCAGGDVDEVQRLRSIGPLALRELFTAFRRACDAIACVDVPVVVAVEGVAMAGGFELMQAADIVLVSDDARIADQHINFGMIPGGGSTQRLPRLVGRQTALGLLLSGDRLSGVDAVRLGPAYKSYPKDTSDDEVERFATTLAARQRDAVTAIKRLVHPDKPLGTGLDEEIDTVVAHICADDLTAFGKLGARG
jgi:enoyl-CoA hydratase/carnithine racemase